MQFYWFYVCICRMNVIYFLMIIIFIWTRLKPLLSLLTPHMFMLGDFNADMQLDSVFGAVLVEFCNLNNLDFTAKCLY